MHCYLSEWRLFIEAVAISALLLSSNQICRATGDVAGELIEWNDNGAWSWFQDERVIVDTNANKILISSVAHGSGSGGASRHGDVEVAALDVTTGDVTRFTLHEGLQADDHNSAALWIRPDGRYIASYSKHGSDQFTRYRVSTNPGDISSWGPEQTFANGIGATYSNLHYLTNDNNGAGRLYNFVRSVHFDPNILVSNDWGTSFLYGGKLLTEGGGGDRPYLRYYSDGQRIHFTATERHPRDFDNSIYHGYIQDGQLFNSQGSLIDSSVFDGEAVSPQDLTAVFTSGSEYAGEPMQRAWNIDVAVDEAGFPYVIFQARANDNDTDHRFFYGRFDGTAWNVHQLAKAGGFLYSPENDYTGLAALDPHDPDRLFISTKIDPRSEDTLPHYEIFEGVTADGGQSWNWSPITLHSTVDNLRPIVPAWDDENTALVWLRGSYNTYTNYDMKVVGLTEIGPLVETILGDLNGNNELDLEDFELYLSGLHSDLSGLTATQAYHKGDLNGDGVNDFQDFRLFRNLYSSAHGAGALAEIAAIQLPETGAMMLAILGAPGVLFWRERHSGNDAQDAATRITNYREMLTTVEQLIEGYEDETAN